MLIKTEFHLVAMCLVQTTNENITAGNHLFQVNNENTRTRCEICSNLTTKTSRGTHRRCSGIFYVELLTDLTCCLGVFYC